MACLLVINVFGIRRPPEHEAERRLYELLVPAFVGRELGGDPGVHRQEYS